MGDGETGIVAQSAAFAGLTTGQIKLLRDMVCRDSTDEELSLFLTVCKKHDADPFLREIYAVKIWDSALNRMAMSIQCGIDFYRKRAADSGAYAGSDEPIFEEMPADHQGYKVHPCKASITVYRIVSGMRVSFSASARWSEYAKWTKQNKLTRFWENMPYSQLAKCAEALALRKAFPREMGEIRTEDEMDQVEDPPAVALLAKDPVPALPPTAWAKEQDAKMAAALANAASETHDVSAPPVDFLRPPATAYKGNGNISQEQGETLAQLCDRASIKACDLRRFLAAKSGKEFTSIADVTRPGYAKLHALLTAVCDGGKYFFWQNSAGGYDPKGAPDFADVTPASQDEFKRAMADEKF